jgi:hypothetical protein
MLKGYFFRIPVSNHFFTELQVGGLGAKMSVAIY